MCYSVGRCTSVGRYTCQVQALVGAYMLEGVCVCNCTTRYVLCERSLLSLFMTIT